MSLILYIILVSRGSIIFVLECFHCYLLWFAHSTAIRELYKVKDKPLIPAKPELRKMNEDIYYDKPEPQVENANIASIRDRAPKQPTLQESESKFLMVADDEFFDAEEPTFWKRGEDPELMSSDEVEGSSMDEEEPEPRNHVFRSLDYLLEVHLIITQEISILFQLILECRHE